MTATDVTPDIGTATAKWYKTAEYRRKVGRIHRVFVRENGGKTPPFFGQKWTTSADRWQGTPPYDAKSFQISVAPPKRRRWTGKSGIDPPYKQVVVV